MATIENIHDYTDIIDQPRHVSKVRKHMLIKDRAAQFAPFAALTGHKEAVSETQRLVVKKKILDENQKEILDYHLQQILLNIKHQPFIRITYFKQDSKKSGGSYITIEGHVKKIDDYHKRMILVEGESISIKDIAMIEEKA